MINSSDLKIQGAKSEGLPHIVNLAQTYDLKQMASEQLAKVGFLVSNFHEEDYRGFIDRADHFYVLLEDRKLCGFLYAYSCDRNKDNEWLSLLIKSRHPAPFIMIKQICIRSDLIGRGLAASLYQHLFSQAREYPLFAAIVLEPVNQRSIIFHERHGFRKVFQITPPDGMLRGIWMRSPEIGRRSNEHD
jgi:predicted GNAT superfamily acetyltransferase